MIKGMLIGMPFHFLLCHPFARHPPTFIPEQIKEKKS